MERADQTLRIAVVGTGIAGLSAAHILNRGHDVTLFEKNDYAGGHTHTIVLPDGPDRDTPVDTGFIVMNHRNYPLLTRLFEQLGVTLRDSDMSFGYHDERSGLQYCGTDLNTMFAQRLNLLRPSFLRMIRQILRFYGRALGDFEAGRLAGLTLGDYLRAGGYGEMFVDHHILPMGSAIWSTPCAEMLRFPAASFVQFFRNHGLLSVSERPQWRTVAGGSHSYVKKIVAMLRNPVRLNAAVRSVRRQNGRVHVAWAGGEEVFDRVVIAAHADEALAMLADPTDEERRLLGPWRYTDNKTVLHSDARVMPPNRRAWASWNSTREEAGDASQPLSLTYDMNRLQGLVTQERYFVTLNRIGPIAQDRVIAPLHYTHPAYTFESMNTQPQLPKLNGANGTYFCGSYFRYGFHEDGIRSGVEVARAFGMDL
ncbi:MAG: 2-enoate reductase FldZ [Verrucomicrobia bacterium ADurb.Bin345]|nr:MAG: 2-enoate reductase FldZ [Verrucomicrobia bacterium ADurb.Bin345]